MKAITPLQTIDDDRLHDLIAEYLRRVDRGEAVDRSAFVTAHPEFAAPLLAYFENELAIDAMTDAPTDGLTCSAVTESVADATTADTANQPNGTHFAPEIPEIFGRYRVLSALGQGAMGAVYLAQDQQLGRQVALKIPKFKGSDTTGMLERFYREARSAALLRHPYICPVFDVGEIHGQHYISMAYIAGRPLSDLIQADQLLAESDVAAIVRKLALALAEAHAHGVIHRDLKPANIIIDSKGEPVVMDFGLAHCATQQDLKATKEGAIIGTIAYMSPEQASGDRAQIGPGSDIYGLGVIFYEMLTGRVPFTGDLMSVLKQIAVDEPKSPSQLRSRLDSRVEAICLTMLAKRSADRYASMNDVAQALDAYLESSDRSRLAKSTVKDLTPALPATHSAVPQSRPLKLRIARHWIVSAGVAVTAIALIVALTQGWLRDGKSVKKENAPPPVIGVKQPIEGDGDSTHLAGGWHGWPADAPSPAIAPFGNQQAEAYQDAWANYLGVPVEHENSIGMRFRLIPPGEFLMGSTPVEIEAMLRVRDDDAWNAPLKRRIQSREAPQRTVILTQPIYLAVHEVTQQQYERITGKNPSAFVPNDPNKTMAPRVAGMDSKNFPVETVNWFDAVDFCIRLSEKESVKPYYLSSAGTESAREGIGYRLPSEAQWEFACRSGTTTRFSSGETADGLSQIAWYQRNSGGRMHTVGESRPNAFGLFDMHGNAYEWCEHWWDPTYYQPSSGQRLIDPNGAPSGTQRVLRGGSWMTPEFGCASLGSVHVPADRWDGSGFRVAISVDGVRELLKRPATSNGRPKDAPSPVVAPFDRDRAAAEWALSIKGNVSIRINGVVRPINAAADLPSEPFAVTRVFLGDQNHHASSLEKLAGLESLGELTLAASVRDDMLDVLAEIPSLQWLNVGGAPLTDAAMPWIGQCRNLETLDLFRTRITDGGFREIRHLSKLKSVLMPAGVTHDGLDALAECHEVEYLKFYYSPVTAAGLRKLARLKKLKQLWLWRCSRVADAEGEELRRFLSLEELSLTATDVGDAGFQSIATLPRLSILDAEGTRITDAGLEKLATNHNLTFLHLPYTQVSDAGMIHLAQMPKLSKLSLIATSVSDDGLKQLYPLKSLKEIWLTDTKVTPDGVAAFKKALPDCNVIFVAAKPASSK